MKIKVKPDDFVVTEQTALRVAGAPDRYRLYRLRKRQWDTFDLVNLLSRRLGVEREDIAVAGIKDRFGATEQLLSVRDPAWRPEAPRGRGAGRGLPARLAENNFSIEHLGWTDSPLSAASLLGNHFHITARDIDAPALKRYLPQIDELARWGVPNYYDEQRFGSSRHGGGFMGKEIFRGKREEALRLYFLPSKHDDRRTRALKSCVSNGWGRWGPCLELAFGEYRRVLLYLKDHPRAFRKALALLDRRFLVFVLNAYQSSLFNELLGAYIRTLAAEQGFPLLHRRVRWGELQFPARLPEDLLPGLRELMLPVPGHDSAPADPLVRRLLGEVLQREGITLEELRVRQMSGLSVHGVQRAALLVPRELSVLEAGPDELYPGKSKLTLEFSLPRGGYATMLLKRLEAMPPAGAGAPPGEDLRLPQRGIVEPTP